MLFSIVNLLNLFFFCCLFTFYNFYFLSIEILLFFIFVTIFFNFFFYLYNILSDYLILKKNEILKEYFLKLYDFFYFLDIYKKKVLNILKNLNFFFNFLKFILIFYKDLFFKKIKFFNFIYIYLINNIFTNFIINNISFNKNYFYFFVNFFFKKINLQKIFDNIFIKSDSFLIFF